MKVRDLSGKIHTWDLRGYRPSPDETRPRSSYHLKCRDLLRELFPLDQILEEVPVPGEQLFLDFFLPSRKMVVEVQGEQHDTYVHFFHKSVSNFKKAQNNDSRKREWAQLNNFRFVELIYNESESNWRASILGIRKASGNRGTG